MVTCRNKNVRKVVSRHAIRICDRKKTILERHVNDVYSLSLLPTPVRHDSQFLLLQPYALPAHTFVNQVEKKRGEKLKDCLQFKTMIKMKIMSDKKQFDWDARNWKTEKKSPVRVE